MRMKKNITLQKLAFILFSVMVSHPAFAQATGSGGTTIGNMISTIAKNISNPFAMLLTGIGFLGGFFLVASGLVKLTQLGQGGRTSMADAMFRIFGGGCLVALPPTISAGVATFYGDGLGSLTSSSGDVGSVSDCLVTAGGTTPLTCVAKNFAVNVVPVFMSVGMGVIYLVGVGMVVYALYMMATGHANGQKNPNNHWFSKFVIGCLVCNLPHLIALIETTMGITNGSVVEGGFVGLNGTSPNTMLSYAGPSIGGTSATTILADYSTLIGYLFVILTIFGLISVWKGISYFKAHAEGDKQKTMGAAMTHIAGGVLLLNGKATTCMITYTLLGSVSLGFCN